MLNKFKSFQIIIASTMTVINYVIYNSRSFLSIYYFSRFIFFITLFSKLINTFLIVLFYTFAKLPWSHTDISILTEALKLVNYHIFLCSDIGSLPFRLINGIDKNNSVLLNDKIYLLISWYVSCCHKVHWCN